jgi:hypothetical protein
MCKQCGQPVRYATPPWKLPGAFRDPNATPLPPATPPWEHRDRKGEHAPTGGDAPSAENPVENKNETDFQAWVRSCMKPAEKPRMLDFDAWLRTCLKQ